MKHFSPWLQRFRAHSHWPGSILLESNQHTGRNGRYNVMAHHPFLILESRQGKTRLESAKGIESFAGNGLDLLDTLLKKYHSPLAPFGPGAFGYFSYELGYPLQKLPTHQNDDLGLPDLWFAFYDQVERYDHVTEEITLIGNREEDPIPLERLLRTSNHDPEARFPAYTQADYETSFKQAMEHIRCGNIYQVNLSQRFSIPFSRDPWELYQTIQLNHPTAYSAYLNTGGHVVLSASPELFLRKEGLRIETSPIKGTIRQNENPDRDLAIQHLLSESQKNQAEHIMIVDLERNDLGRICKTGSIVADNLMHLESCGEVHHLVSNVVGELREDVGIRQIIEATFPGGSITGAPKRKAMEIIATLEPVARGIYTGALGWIGFSGDFVLNLPIRTVLVQDEWAHLYLGSGVVADSKSNEEYQEILDKGSPFFKALESSPYVPLLS